MLSCKFNAIKDFDISQSEGISVSLWLQGCEHKCVGCFSPHTWDFNQGEDFTEETIEFIVHLLTKDEIHKNLSVLGGETLSTNKLGMLEKLLKRVKEINSDIQVWLWTGYTYEEVGNLSLMSFVDILIDGKYEKELHNPTRYKGSDNQRVIDVKESKEQKKVIFYSF